MKRILAGILCAAMVAGIALIPSVVEPVKVQAATAPKPITLTFFSDGNTQIASSGVTNDPVAKHIAEVTGVTINNIIGDISKFRVMVAGGNLPDICCIPNDQLGASLCQNMIKAKQVIPLDSLITQYAPGYAKANPTTIKYSKMFLGAESGTTGPLYYLPSNVNVAQKDNPNVNGFVGFFTRYDLYQSIGSPTIKNDTDYLNALKKMVDLQPKAQNGVKTYALSGWTDWGLWPYIISYPFAHGYTNSGLSGSFNLVTMKYENNYLDPNSVFWKGIRFMYMANQLGIFDPQAFTQKQAQYDQELKNGSLLVSAYNWTAPDPTQCGNDAGLFIIPGTNPYISQVFPEDQFQGYSVAASLCISSKCKYPDRAMQLIEYANSDDGARWILNGPKSVTWDVKDNKPQLIGNYLAFIQSGGAQYPEFGQVGNATYGISFYSRLVLSQPVRKGTDGYPIGINQSIDFKIASASPAQQNFTKVYGKAGDVFPGQAYSNMVNTGLAKNVPTYPLTSSLGVQPSNFQELSQISGQADTYIQDNLPKFILAKNDADFDAQVAAAIEAVKAMGMDKVNTAEIKVFQDSAATVQKFLASK